jgi:hypothetical protein
VLRRERSGCRPRRRAPRVGRALSDFRDADTVTVLREVVKDGQVARDLRTDLDASGAALALLDTYLGTLPTGSPSRQPAAASPTVLDTVLTALLPPAERGVNGSSG